MNDEEDGVAEEAGGKPTQTTSTEREDAMPTASRSPEGQRGDREAELEARVRDLEDQLYQRQGSTRRGGRRRDYYEGTREDFRSFGDRKVDEVARLFTGVLRAGLESVRVASETATYFVDDALERNIPDSGEDSVEVASRFPGDLKRASVHSLDRGLDAPRRAAERFNRVYQEDEGGARRTRARRRDDLRDLSRHELEVLAEDQGISNPSAMSRAELVDAIRSHRPPLEDWSKAELNRRARELQISGASQLSRDQLIAAIRERESKP